MLSLSREHTLKQTQSIFLKIVKISDLGSGFPMLSNQFSLPMNFATLMIRNYKMHLECREEQMISDEKENTHNIFQRPKF